MRNGRSMGLGEQLLLPPPAFSKILTHVGFVGHASNKTSPHLHFAEVGRDFDAFSAKATDLMFEHQQLCSTSLGAPQGAWENHLFTATAEQTDAKKVLASASTGTTAAVWYLQPRCSPAFRVTTQKV